MAEDAPGVSTEETPPLPDGRRLNWHAPKFIVEKVTYVTATKPGSSGADANPNISHTS